MPPKYSERAGPNVRILPPPLLSVAGSLNVVVPIGIISDDIGPIFVSTFVVVVGLVLVPAAAPLLKISLTSLSAPRALLDALLSFFLNAKDALSDLSKDAFISNHRSFNE